MSRKIVVSEYVTVDGFMDEPGEWSMPFFSDEAAQFKKEELFASDALLLGRLTYEGFAAAWPTMEDTDGFADKMNGMPKYVASRTLTEVGWNATVIQGDVAAQVAKLKEGSGGDLLVGGSNQLVDLLSQHDLVDEYRLMVHPIVLGNGTKRLFAGAPRRTLALANSVAFANGVTVQTYHPAG